MTSGSIKHEDILLGNDIDFIWKDKTKIKTEEELLFSLAKDIELLIPVLNWTRCFAQRLGKPNKIEVVYRMVNELNSCSAESREFNYDILLKIFHSASSKGQIKLYPSHVDRNTSHLSALIDDDAKTKWFNSLYNVRHVFNKRRRDDNNNDSPKGSKPNPTNSNLPKQNHAKQNHAKQNHSTPNPVKQNPTKQHITPVAKAVGTSEVVNSSNANANIPQNYNSFTNASSSSASSQPIPKDDGNIILDATD